MYKHLSIISVLCLLGGLCLSSTATADNITQPLVSRRVIVCDKWQWIGSGAITWGCLTTPREAQVAGGTVTDEVITSLQNQINQLQSQLKKLDLQKTRR